MIIGYIYISNAMFSYGNNWNLFLIKTIMYFRQAKYFWSHFWFKGIFPMRPSDCYEILFVRSLHHANIHTTFYTHFQWVWVSSAQLNYFLPLINWSKTFPHHKQMLLSFQYFSFCSACLSQDVVCISHLRGKIDTNWTL